MRAMLRGLAFLILVGLAVAPAPAFIARAAFGASG